MMKKILALLVLITVLLASAAAEDLSSLSDDELLSLHRAVLEEMTNRGLPFGEYATDDETGYPESRGVAAESAAEPEEIDGSTVLYYHPEGGEYYHLDENCRRVHPSYLALKGRFLYSELGEDAYRELQPCEICGAPARPE